MKPLISIIVAMDKNNLIGEKNNIPWHIPSELKRFRSLTMGKPIVMGRKTHESIGKILDGRDNIVLTSNQNYFKDGVIIYNDLMKVFQDFSNHEEIFVIGGSEIYQLAMPFTEKLYITYVEGSFSGDTWFPQLDLGDWEKVYCEDFVCPKTHIKYSANIYNKFSE
tara:strand:- start:634 stop:1128 length:495 start_codon:yes stop_codon:yes gene_type:complete